VRRDAFSRQLIGVQGVEDGLVPLPEVPAWSNRALRSHESSVGQDGILPYNSASSSSRRISASPAGGLGGCSQEIVAGELDGIARLALGQGLLQGGDGFRLLSEPQQGQGLVLQQAGRRLDLLLLGCLPGGQRSFKVCAGFCIVPLVPGDDAEINAGVEGVVGMQFYSLVVEACRFVQLSEVQVDAG